MVESHNLDAQHVASIIRFDGGVPVWEIKADTGVFSKLPVVGSGDKFATKSVTYSKVPDHFAQVTPETGPPEPLEAGHYYIFTAQRASGPPATRPYGLNPTVRSTATKRSRVREPATCSAAM